MDFGNLKFGIGFWHPFGPHGEETAEEIIKRKQKEIADNGWTLWSFQRRTNETLQSWSKEIKTKNPNNALVFCSDSKNARAPAGKTKDCEYYLPIGTSEKINIPHKIKVSHPMGKLVQTGSAFIVKKIVYPAHYTPMNIKWFFDGKDWRTDRMPTRGEYLTKTGQGEPIRKFLAILELKKPYLAEVGIDNK